MSDLGIDLNKQDPNSPNRGNNGKTGRNIALGLAGIGVAGLLIYYGIKTASSTISGFGNEAQQQFSQCSSTVAAERATYMKLFNEYITNTGGNPTSSQLADLKTVQLLISSTVATCISNLTTICKQDPQQCPGSPLPTFVAQLGTGAMWAEVIASAGITGTAAAIMYKKLVGSSAANPKSSLTGAGNAGEIQTATVDGKVAAGEVTPEEASSLDSTLQDTSATLSEDMAAETDALNSVTEEEIISTEEEAAIEDAMAADFAATEDELVMLFE
ncbi:MAG: hypothetical protein QXL94_03350 [Candidatus Parvarchaeum sp.]